MLSELLRFILGDKTPSAPVREPVCPQCAVALAPLDGAPGSAWCHACKGLWLQQELFSNLLKADSDRLDARLLEGEGSYETTYAASERRTCAVCDARMDNYQFQYQSGIWIDACPKAHGIWLDPGELRLIRAWRDAGATPAATPMRVHRKGVTDPRALAAMTALDAMTKSGREVNEFRTQVEEERRRNNAESQRWWDQHH